MKKVLAVLGIFTCGILFSQEFKMSIGFPMVATLYNGKDAYVMGKDAKMRVCGGDANMYVRIDGKTPADKNLYYVMPGQTLIPNNQQSYSAVCIKMGN